MKRPLSAYSKAIVAGLAAAAGAIVATFPDSTAGKWAAVIVALLGALGLTAQTRNTQTVETGPGVDVSVGDVVSSTGTKVGEVIVDTGLATGGIVAGTTGVVGQVLDATVGKLLPSGRRRG